MATGGILNGVIRHSHVIISIFTIDKMSKIHLFSVFLALSLAALFASCSGDGFKIDGNLTGLETPEVRVVFSGDSGIVDEWVNLDKKGHFSYKGVTSQPVLVSILDHSNKVLATVIVTGGDHLKIKGDASKAMGVKVKGNRLNEEWQLFRDEHAAFYTDTNPSRLNAAIEKYVREHPNDMLSTVLLMADYTDFSDRGKVEKLLQGIDIAARPASLTTAFGEKRESHMPRLVTLKLWKFGGTFEEIKLAGDIKFLSLWANPQTNRNGYAEKIKDLRESVHVIDILAESDSMRWHQTIAGEDWQHYWAPAGPMEQGIHLLGITSLPWYAVTDSTGLVVYSGPNFDDAKKNALDKIKSQTKD